jgi:chitin disaccharide deacetylase
LKQLVINADDFGFTRDVNAGIVQAHREGVLTATTLMANGDAFEDAVRLARATPTLDLGCHLVLVQGYSLLTGKPLPKGPRQLVATLARGGLDVYGELRAQIEKILAAGLTLTHLDTHKHTHLMPPVFRAVARLAQKFGIPWVRLPFDRSLPLLALPARYYRAIARRYGVRHTDHFLGFRLTGCLTEGTFAATLATLPQGVTEFMCHPGILGPELANAETRLKQERVRELEALTSPRIRRLMGESKVRLCAFSNLAGFAK